jgi:mono/diheme cytochrome c family protein
MTNRADKRSRSVGLGRFALSALSLFGAACFGCNSLDEPTPEDGSEFHLVVPTDLRPAFSAETKPPAVTGGTVAVTPDGQAAVVSDAERDRLVVIAIGPTAAVLGTVPFSPGDEPGRVIVDSAGRAHVALRRGGAVASVDLGRMTVVERREVCGAPRGVTQTGPDTLTVACADGTLVTMPASGGAATRTVRLAPDLRDVVVTSTGELVVSRFKSAELLRLDAAGAVTRRDWPGRVLGARNVPTARQTGHDGPTFVTRTDPFRANVAWRSLAGPNGSVVVVHQRALESEIELVPRDQNVSSYGGGSDGGGCGAISQNALTVVGPNGATRDLTFAGSPLPVDATFVDGGARLVIVHAGVPDPDAPRPFVLFEGDTMPLQGARAATPEGGRVSTLSVIDVPPPSELPGEGQGEDGDDVAADPGCGFNGTVQTDGPAVAVASIPTLARGIVVQTRQPSALVIMDDLWSGQRVVSFDDEGMKDTGFALFHRDSGAGIACASCHPEGAEDGNVWRFSDTGARRTQSLQADLGATAPFHWDGTLGSVDSIMSRVFVDRMGGVHQSPARLAALRDWLFSQQAPAPMRSAEDPAVERGRLLFDSTGCGDCHTGEHLTNNRTANVGTGEALQVPSLVGVGYRAPFMHDGCANTLADRFNPSCGGGESHGRVRGLAGEDLTDMVAYLESL